MNGICSLARQLEPLTKEIPIITSDETGKITNPEVATSETVVDIKTGKSEFAKTATAAKMSGAYHEAAGILKRKFGEMTDNAELKEAGKDQQLLGKVHSFVGSLRAVREAAIKDFNSKYTESQAICLKHGGRLLDVATDFVNDMKKALLK